MPWSKFCTVGTPPPAMTAMPGGSAIRSAPNANEYANNGLTSTAAPPARVAADAGRPIVEDEVAVVVAPRADRVRRAAGRVDIERHQQVPDDLVVERDVQPVADVAAAGPHSAVEVAGGGNAERAVGVVLERRQRVVGEHRRALPVDERRVEGRQQGAGIDRDVQLQLMQARAGVRHDLDDVAEERVRPHAVDRRVEVEPPRQPRSARVAVGRARLQPARARR